MVGKLFKHEIKYYLRSILFVEIILMAVALVTRLIQFLEFDSVVYDIVFGSSVIMLVITMLASIFMIVLLGIVRFYKNLFTHEGYLSFTLPVTATQQLFVKITTYMMFMALTIVSLFVAFSIATFGEVFWEISKAGIYLLNRAGDAVGNINLTLYILEFALLLFVTVVHQMLTYYLCMSVGQLTGKNRIWLSIGVYFGIYVITQVFETILVVIYSILDSANALDVIIEFIGDYPKECLHFGLCFGIVFYAVLGGAYFLISRYIMNRKLNLE